jgi:hypothetical protein
LVLSYLFGAACGELPLLSFLKIAQRQ